ncbi:hypothetical protein ARALYDRAFT_905504 [Arabidopsis lyrata subsp. lyrata]|uniref:Uncharacterized protein n=1 Tax=Arabidopsis lyrata subsp. lyrata TaxID=81972 RepID=D7LMH2_ARALL|nr:hypothetical protein ARALYDRAFT_905504 [Arabidopsis lyrata subsp. lyrata]
MDDRTYKLIGSDYPGNNPEDVIYPGLWWMTGFLFVVSFLGLFSLVPLRKGVSEVMILDYKLTYATATAMLINSFHYNTGAELAGLVWSCFKWFFSGIGDACGFDHFPTLGLTLFKNTFYFDFSPTFIGCGMICPHLVNCSVLLGAIISWGFLWPFISQHVFIAIAIILGDGLYNLIKIIIVTVKEICNKSSKQHHLLVFTDNLGAKYLLYMFLFHLSHYLLVIVRVINKVPLMTILKTSVSNIFLRGSFCILNSDKSKTSELMREKKKRDDIFLKDRIPLEFAVSGYVGLAAISTAIIPLLFPPLKCWAHGYNGGVIAGLAACGIMMSIVSTVADLMQDFKTGYLTLSSAKSMFVTQLLGTAMGCIIAPVTFWLFWTAFDIGDPDGLYKAPYAVIYREMAILEIEGFAKLPKHCLTLCCRFFIAALIVNL